MNHRIDYIPVLHDDPFSIVVRDGVTIIAVDFLDRGGLGQFRQPCGLWVLVPDELEAE